MDDNKHHSALNRREFIGWVLRIATVLGLGGIAGFLVKRIVKKNLVWQIDPTKCVQCEGCATNCVLSLSAVKCVHVYDMCGYCELCGGYFEPSALSLDTAAENQLCPTGAIKRTFIEDPYYKYDIDEELCIGCGKCVKGCSSFGNGSLQLQVRHDRCVNCNQCAIAIACPADAFVQVPSNHPYLLKGLDV